MSSTATTRNRFNKQGSGDNSNTWGDVLNTQGLDLVDAALDGWATLTLTASRALTSTNYAADEARMRVLKINSAAQYTQTLPAVEKSYFVWNASSTDQVIASAGGGDSVTLSSGALTWIVTDGVDVKEQGFGGYGLKTYIDAAVLAATGDLPAVTGNSGKFLLCDGTNWNPTTFSAAASAVRTGTTTSSALTPGGAYSAFAEVTLTDAATIAVDMATFINGRVTLTDNRTLGNPTNAKVGQSGYIAVVQDATGSRTLTFSSNWKREGGAPTLSTAAATVDYIFYQVISSSLIVYGFVKAPA